DTLSFFSVLPTPPPTKPPFTGAAHPQRTRYHWTPVPPPVYVRMVSDPPPPALPTPLLLPPRNNKFPPIVAITGSTSSEPIIKSPALPAVSGEFMVPPLVSIDAPISTARKPSKSHIP